MFNLQYDVVEYSKLKKLNPDESFFTIISYLEIEKQGKHLTEQRYKGEIELKEYTMIGCVGGEDWQWEALQAIIQRR